MTDDFLALVVASLLWPDRVIVDLTTNDLIIVNVVCIIVAIALVALAVCIVIVERR